MAGLFFTALKYIAIFLVGWYALSKLRKSLRKNYPPMADGICLPFLGHILGFGPGPVQFFLGQYDKLGDIFSFELFGRDCVFLGGTQAQTAFYESPDEVLSAAEAYKFTIPAFGPGVIYDATVEKFSEERTMISKSLTKAAFRSYVSKIEDEVNAYVDEFWKKDSDIINFSEAIGEITIRTSTRCLQGSDIRNQVHMGWARYMDDLDKALTPLSFFYPNLPLPTFRKRNNARKQIGMIIKNIIAARRENPNREVENDIIEVLMGKHFKKDNRPVTDNEIAGMMIALTLAGQHTSSITTSWLAIMSLSQPEVKEAIRKEQSEVLEKGQKLDFETIEKMEFLHNSVKETLRLRPPIILIWRKALQDFTYRDYIVPKGTLVCVSPVAYHLMKDSVYTEPYKFDPSRFGASRQEDKKDQYSYLSFSQGRHSCIGEKFAFLQIKTIWTTLLSRFNLSLIGKLEDYPVDNTTVLAGPVGPIKVKYERI